MLCKTGLIVFKSVAKTDTDNSYSILITVSINIDHSK